MAGQDNFVTNLLRAAVAELHYANLLRAAQERYSMSLHKLAPPDVAALQQAVLGDVGALYNLLTPEFLSTTNSTGVPSFGTPPGGTLQ
jgi:hypothetical protein